MLIYFYLSLQSRSENSDPIAVVGWRLNLSPLKRHYKHSMYITYTLNYRLLMVGGQIVWV